MNPEKDLYGTIPRKKRLAPTPDVTSTTPLTTTTTAASADPFAAPVPRKSLSIARPLPSVPRKPQQQHLQHDRTYSTSPPLPSRGLASSPITAGNNRRSADHIKVISEEPLVLRIQTTGINMRSGIHSTQLRASTKRPRPATTVYQDLLDTDSEGEMVEHDATLSSSSSISKKPKRLRKSPLPNFAEQADPSALDEFLEEKNVILTPADPNAIDSPPPGHLNTLWYSRECFLHVFVLEKIVGWKTRPKAILVSTHTNDDTTSTTAPEGDVVLSLDAAEATALQQRALTAEQFWNDPRRRNEVSRVNPSHCPTILAMAAAKDPDNKQYKVLSAEREEVLLVKWRGRSHLHCSWERASDLQKLDPSNNSTARNKIRRFYQTQETVYGSHWKQVLDEDRKTGAQLHSHGELDGVGAGSGNSLMGDEDLGTEDDEFYSPQCLEIERILACDENEINMEVFSKQRALNILNERRQDAEKQQQLHANAIQAIAKHFFDGTYPEVAWDPEDNVRYVVKWKGLPYAEITEEYWRDIKQDAVDEAEDFWLRQQPPDLESVIQAANRPHPHLKDFRKLQESPVYGLSKRKRPVADLGNSTKSNDDDGDEVEAGFRLRSYQLEGVNWLLFNYFCKKNPILCDEMGLGKTIQSAAFLQQLQSQPATQIRGPFLIVAPLSLVGQWQSELHSWAPDMNVLLYHGSADARDFLVKHEFYYTDQFVPKQVATKLKKHHVTKFNVLITTYEVVLKDNAVLSKIRWKTLIVDEAHRLKNSKSRLFEDLATVPRDYCVLLTGTPIANATEELWALLHFANPTVFDDKDKFLEKFGEMTDAKQVNELHSLLKPYLLRRVKEDVEKSLPPKEETILEVALTPIQKTFYKAIYERNTSFLYKGAKPSNAPSLMNVMMELRKCCNHPYLVKGAEERIVADAATKLKDKADENGKPVTVDHQKLFAEQLVNSSGKMVLLDKLLPKLFAGGHKVLIFSQMVRVLDLLEELLKLKKYKYERLDGSTSSSLRAHAVERFGKKSLQRFVMLLSTRAGGLGLNLTAADVVIIFDSDWNPQNDLQAMARAHRIGQTRAVRVYRLLTAKTYEMHMFHSASLKLGLERAVLSQNREQGDDYSDENGNNSKKQKKKSDREAQAREIDELLKKGAYDVFRDEDDTEAEKFMETDIDQLLERSSKTVTYGATATSTLGSGLGSFSKASFVANTGDGEKDVDLDDPDFWSKAVGLEAPVETPEDVAAMIDDGVKRSRKQVQVYDPYAETAEAEKLKKERLALEKMLEKEEKERLKLEKKRKKQESQEKKKKEREEMKAQKQEKKAAVAAATAIVTSKSSSIKDLKKLKDGPKPIKVQKDIKPKISKKNERQRALRRAEYEEPLIERLKQAWEVPQRNRATAATLRFGFGRFCKIRHESNLLSLPLQDIEAFVRSYIFQLGMQVVVILLAKIQSESVELDIRPMFYEWLGIGCFRELNWICDTVRTAMFMKMEIDKHRRLLRMPMTLMESPFLKDLRSGAAFRALRRVGILARIHFIVEERLDSILLALGREELGKRGCTNELESLDADLKARFVTSEELALSIGTVLGKVQGNTPASWWDRKCDVALILGTFVHGFGNYEAMRNDSSLPFGDRIRNLARRDEACKRASHSYRVVAAAVRKVFDDALESAKIKAELEVQAAVAAAAKAASKREEDAALLRKGGAEAEAVISAMPDTQVENAFAFDGTDSHFVTLTRMYTYVQEAAHKEANTVSSQYESKLSISMPEQVKGEDDENDNDEEDASTGRIRDHHLLPMPDSRVLDHRLVRVLQAIESNFEQESSPGLEPDEMNPDLWMKSDDILTNLQVRAQTLPLFLGFDAEHMMIEYSGIGLGGNQCGTSHRSLNDGADFSFGSGSSQLAQVAYGPDAPRFLRALGVPMNVTRFAVNGLVYAEPAHIERLLAAENLRFYGTEDPDVVKSLYAREDGREVLSCSTTLSPKPFDPLSLIPVDFRENTKLRAYTCMAVLFYGFPSVSMDAKFVQQELVECIGADEREPLRLFDRKMFRDAVVALARDVEVPEESVLSDYIELHLLPHSLKLCLYGNGPVTRTARGSEGRYETAFGVSIHPEPSTTHPSPLPDPCFSLQEHSLEALGTAGALLRRVRLSRSSGFICSDPAVRADAVLTSTKSKLLGDLGGMPVWWCPWIHDVALLIQAATGGLFSVFQQRENHPVFSVEALENYMYSKFVPDFVPGGPTQAPSAQAREWVESQVSQFPTLLQLERRLAFLCSKVTAENDSAIRYDNLPMFDHGGWPRD